MKSDLDRAKELKSSWDYHNKIISDESKDEEDRVDSDFAITYYFDESKQLKEKVEYGCGIEHKLDDDSLLPTVCQNNWLCKDCQETLKVLNEILGEKE